MIRITTIVPREIGRYITDASAGLGFAMYGVGRASTWLKASEEPPSRLDQIRTAIPISIRPFQSTIVGIRIAITIRRGWLSE